MKYRNISQNDLVIPDLGIALAGKEIESPFEINNISLELVSEEPKVVEAPAVSTAPVAPVVAPVVAPAPAPVVAPVAPVVAPTTEETA
jgi:hypothetical protein